VASIEQTARKLDYLDEVGERLLTDEEIDFNSYSMDYEEGKKVKHADSYVDNVVSFFTDPESHSGYTLPWGDTHTDIRLRPGELSIWAGINGHGKSMVLSQVALSLQRQGARICIASMEMKPVQTMARMSRQGIGGEQPTEEVIRRFHESLDGLFLYDQQGTVQHKNMLAVVRYCREELGINHFIIDSLMKCGINGDDYNAQKNFVDKLSTYAKDTGMHIHLVCHSRKTENEFKQMGKFDIKGAGEITDMADNVFTIWRNKKKEEKVAAMKATQDEADAPDCVMRCDKQRNGEWEGKIGLWFIPRALQYVAKRTNQTIDYLG